MFQSPSYRGKPSFKKKGEHHGSDQGCFSPLLIGVSPPSKIMKYTLVVGLFCFSPLLIGVSPPSQGALSHVQIVEGFQSPSYRGKPSFVLKERRQMRSIPFQSPSYRGKPSFKKVEDTKETSFYGF